MSDRRSEPRLVVVETAKNPLEAQVIAAILRDAGVAVYVGGAMLADEFAASQRLMGIGGVSVQVMSDRLEEARQALVESRAAGAAMDEATWEAIVDTGDEDASAPGAS